MAHIPWPGAGVSKWGVLQACIVPGPEDGRGPRANTNWGQELVSTWVATHCLLFCLEMTSPRLWPGLSLATMSKCRTNLADPDPPAPPSTLGREHNGAHGEHPPTSGLRACVPPGRPASGARHQIVTSRVQVYDSGSILSSVNYI